jgi:hypothetical protein
MPIVGLKRGHLETLLEELTQTPLFVRLTLRKHVTKVIKRN